MDPGSVKVYTVNGAASGSSSSLPDWLTRKRAASKKSKREIRERIEGTLELIQSFEFPEASNRIRTTKDGHHAIATGTYKPQMRVWDLDQLSLKFERHSDAENVDFIILSDDWTKTIHLQNDRSIALHNQSGFYYSTRIPRFGRALGYHYPSCDAIIAATGPEVYRLNLDQGRFLNPLVLQGNGDEEISGVNCVDINPAHQLWAFGCEGNGAVELWDPRSRAKVGLLRLPGNRLMPTGVEGQSLSVTAISSRSDGLSYAVGTSTGHSLLYDIRSPKPYATKDQGYGLPVKKVMWIEGGNKIAGDGMVLSADKKVVKIWDRNEPSSNFTSITPAHDLNDVHHVTGSGVIMLANEGIQMTTYYIPQLGPAPRWCSFLENITEEMEDQTARTAYEDYKFVDRNELSTLGLDHLVGTPALKPYMHGYFVSLKLYDTARAIANPFAYAEHRERIVREKMEKMAETRIRAPKNAAVNVKVNKGLADRIAKEEAREKVRQDRKKQRKLDSTAPDDEFEKMEVDMDEQPNLISDPRFKALFQDPEFEVDETSREFALMNPSLISKRREKTAQDADQSNRRVRTKTAVEEEEEEEVRTGLSSDEDGASEEDQDPDDADSSEDDDLVRNKVHASTVQEQKQERSRPKRAPAVRLVPLKARGSDGQNGKQKDATFGQRRRSDSRSIRRVPTQEHVSRAPDGGMEISWVPSSSKDRSQSRTGDSGGKRGKDGVESFGLGMEKGERESSKHVSESDRSGRTQRRTGVRSGSKNTFRRI